MSFATTNQTGLYSVAEATWGVVPTTPMFQELRFTGEGINYGIENITSDEIRSDRMVSDTIQVGQSTDGNFDFELSYGSFDHFMESALYSAFVSANTAATDTTFTAAAGNGSIAFDTSGTVTFGSDHTLDYVDGQRFSVTGSSDISNDLVYTVVGTAGQVITVLPVPGATVSDTSSTIVTGRPDYIGAGVTNLEVATDTSGTITFGSAHTIDVAVGQWVQLGGFADADTNAYYRVTGVAGNVLTVSPAPNATESNTTTGWASSSRLRNAPSAAGIVQKSFTMQKVFNDATSPVYQTFSGMVVDTMSMSFEVGAILTGSFGFMGRSADLGAVAGSTIKGSTTTDVMNSVSNLVNVEFDNVDTTSTLLSMTIDTTGNLRAQKGIGSLPSVGVGTGRFEVTGSISFYFDSAAEYQKFLSNTSQKLSFRVQDEAGNAYAITFPKVKYEGMTMNAGGLDGDVELSGTYRALLGTADGINYQMEIDRLPSTF